MFPKKFPTWFFDWNDKNPTNIYKSGIFVGLVGAPVFVVIGLLTLGQPFKTESLQTGPRGQGMSRPEFINEVTRPDPTIAGYLSAADITEDQTAAISAEALANVPPALEGIPEDEYARLLVAMRAWTGIPDLMEDPDSYQTEVAYSMVEMTQALNDDWGGHTQANAVVGVSCYTCHRGQAVPSEIWFSQGESIHARAAEGWGAVQNKVTSISQFTSLPSDALEQYLINYEQIGVHDLEAHVAEYPSDGIQTWQHAERTFSFMNYFSNSLGVNCVFCHNSRAFYDGAQVTPQWATASLGISMSQEINEFWLLELDGTLPEERLGPLGDVPKAACKTCHKGYQKPLQGMDMVTDWPALAGPEPY